MDYNADILLEKKPGLVIYAIAEEETRNERRYEKRHRPSPHQRQRHSRYSMRRNLNLNLRPTRRSSAP